MKRSSISLMIPFILAGLVLTGCGQASPAGDDSREPVAAAVSSLTNAPVDEPAAAPSATAGAAVPVETRVPAPAFAFDPAGSYQPVPVAGTYKFAEGPATAADGSVYFSDIDAGRIYRWTPDGDVSVFREGLNRPNGLAFDPAGSLVVCEGGNGRLISIDDSGSITVLAEQYRGIRFNAPNDLWIDPKGGIYFTDPAYQTAQMQDGEHVYYQNPEGQVSRVIDDLVRPNGVTGSADGQTLFVADAGAGAVYAYAIQPGGALADKRLLIHSASDGLDLDVAGNLYLTVPYRVDIYDAGGTLLTSIPLAENPTNLAFTGQDGATLFITARTQVYSVELGGGGEKTGGDSARFTLTSPAIGPDGRLPVEYTCDGDSASLELEWSGAPAGTQSFAVIMHHNAPDMIKWYEVVYDIPADVSGLPENGSGVGTRGTNSVNGRQGFEPPCSKGPGDKEYIYTVYALSAAPRLSVPPAQVGRVELLSAMQGLVLGSAELHVLYSRP